MNRFVRRAALMLLLAAPAAAQDRPLPEGVRAVVEVRAVDLDVVATKGGVPVDDLTKDEVAIRVDGKALPLDYFARVTAGTVHGPDLATASPDLILETAKGDDWRRYVPRQFLVYFDDAHLLPAERARVIESLRDFVTRLTPSDRVSIVSFGTTTRVFVPFTASKEDLLDGLSRLEKTAPAGAHYDAQYRSDVDLVLRLRRGGRIGFAGAATVEQMRGIIRSYSQQAFAREKGTLEELRRAVAALGARPGKRVLLYVSNGIELHPGQSFVQALGPAGSQLEQFDKSVVDDFRAVVAEANRVGVTIDALDAAGLTTDVDAGAAQPSPFSSFLTAQNLREALSGFADATGGVFVADRNQFAPSLDRIYRESSTYYSVGVTLTNVDPRVKEHKVQLTTTRPGVVLRARREVATLTPDEAARDRMEAALLNPGANGDFAATLTIGAPRKGGGVGHRLLSYDVGVPVAALTVREEGGKRVAPLEISIAAVSDKGERSGISTQRVTAVVGAAGAPAPDTWHLTGDLKSGRGNYRFVATVRDLATDRMAVASAPVRVE